MKGRTIGRVFAFLLLFLLLTNGVGAIEITTDEGGSRTANAIDDDLLFLGDSLDLSGRVDTLFFFGKFLDFTGGARRSLIAAAETMNVGGEVAHNGLIAARTINVDGTIGSTTFAASETFTLFPQARVDGALFAAANRAAIEGDVEGDLFVAARRIVISGRINGDVQARGEEIRIDPSAEILGNFTYRAERELTADERSRIQGTVRIAEKAYEDEWIEKGWITAVGKWVFPLIGSVSVLVFALLFYLFPGLRKVDAERTHSRFWKTVAWGLIPFFLYPFAIAALFLAGILFGITVPIGLAFAFGTGVLAYLLWAFALPQIGSYVALIFSRELRNRSDTRGLYLKLLLGFPVVLVLSIIPVVNGLFFVLFLSLGWGVALEKLFGRKLGIPADQNE